MKQLFVDTNILIDLLSQREPFYKEAAVLFSLADLKRVRLSVSSLTIANTHYILSRQMNSSMAKAVLRKLGLIVEILPVNSKIVELALNDVYFSDFGDAIQYYCALENSQEQIITRNISDFKKSKLPVLTAVQFLVTMKL